MSKIIGTQEFLAKHEGHFIRYSLVKSIDHIYQGGTIQKYVDGSYCVSDGELMEKVEVQTTGAYVFCDDCSSEEMEVNIWEVDD